AATGSAARLHLTGLDRTGPGYEPRADRGALRRTRLVTITDRPPPGPGAATESTPPTPQPATPPPVTAAARRYRGLVRSAYVFLLLCADVAGLSLAFGVGYWLRALTEQRPSRISPLESYQPTLVFLIVAVVITFALMRLYLPRR